MVLPVNALNCGAPLLSLLHETCRCAPLKCSLLLAQLVHRTLLSPRTNLIFNITAFPLFCRCWLDRRQIDGSLNRTPPGFYDRVWQILERTPNGIVVAGKHLPQVKFTQFGRKDQEEGRDSLLSALQTTFPLCKHSLF